jgi:SNF2 family DNA or RNA helicase
MPKLWSHQSRGSAWLKSLPHAFLAAGMGTGKSATLLDAVRDARLVLVVCPIAVGPAWKKQIGIWDSGRRCVVAVAGSGPSRAKAIRAACKSKGRVLVVVNYESVWRGEVAKAITEAEWNVIALDESHKVKSPNGRCSKWLAKLSASNPKAQKICMTGTPCPHSPLDWWSQFRFLNPDLLPGPFGRFRATIAVTHPRFPGWITGWRREKLDELGKTIDPYVWRVESKDVLDLPELLHETVEVTLSPKTRRYYDTLEEQMTAEIGDGSVTVQNKLVLVSRLQLATSGKAPLDGASPGETVDINGVPEKARALADLLEGLDEPAVVVCKFRRDIEEVHEVCKKLGKTSSELSGARKELEAWQAGETDVLVLQQQAGGAGIDCTRSSFMFFYSLSHSLGDFEQTIARVWRPGQEKCTRCYHLIATETVDETIYGALQGKKDVVESVIERLQRRVAA